MHTDLQFKRDRRLETTFNTLTDIVRFTLEGKIQLISSEISEKEKKIKYRPNIASKIIPNGLKLAFRSRALREWLQFR